MAPSFTTRFDKLAWAGLDRAFVGDVYEWPAIGHENRDTKRWQ